MRTKKPTFLERARLEIAAGRPWRAKELLKSSVPGGAYDRAVYREYGELLQMMGEPVEAGKYLLLAGSDLPEHAEAIQLFLERHGASVAKMVSHFPTRARDLPVESYPASLRRVLEQGGYQRPVRPVGGGPRDAELPGKLMAASLVGCLAFAFLCAVIGFIQIVRWALALAA